MIYLDHAATTPPDPAVVEAMLRSLRADGDWANPASDHGPGRAARLAVEQARAQVAALLGARPDEIIWTSGATESDNLALQGAMAFHTSRGRHLVTARTEHKAVLDTARALQASGHPLTLLDPEPDGRVAVARVLEALRDDTALVSLMWVNNETGVIQDIEALAPALRERGVLFHVDAAQAAGKLPIDLAAVPVDLLSVTAHKLHGPKGIGALFVRKRPRARLHPLLHGGGHEQGMRSGTLPTHQVVGMGQAFELAGMRLVAEAPRFARLRQRLLEGLIQLGDVHENGAGAPTVGNILNLSFGGVEGESLRAALPDLAVSSGAACSAVTQEPSYVLRALGRSDDLAGSSLRFSFGNGTTEAEIDAAAIQVAGAVRRLRALAPEPA